MNISKNRIKAAIITISFVTMGVNGISSIISDIAKAFPSVSISTVQFLMTFPSFFITIFSIISAFLLQYFSKKKLVEGGLILIILSGLFSFCFHNDLRLLFVFSGMMGIGIGLIAPIVPTLTSDLFDGKEKVSLMGFQTGAQNFGCMLMTFIGGFLAIISWYFNYLVYFVAVPGLILTILYIPENEQMENQHFSIKKLSSVTWIYSAVSTVFLFLFAMIPTNLSLYITERNIGNSTLTGIAVTIFLLGGLLMGLCFGKISSKISILSIPLGFFILACGIVLISFSVSKNLIFCGCLIAGASISLVMPQCLLNVSNQINSNYSAFACAIVLSAGNIGTFLTPVITTLCKVVFNKENTADRLIFTSELAISLCIIIFLLILFSKNVKRKNIVRH
jgi:MFS family permease